MWKIDVLRALRLVAYIGAVVLVWLIVKKFELLPGYLLEMGTPIIAAILFIVGLPLSLLLRVEILRSFVLSSSQPLLLLLALSIAALNIMIIQVFRGFMARNLGRERSNND